MGHKVSAEYSQGYSAAMRLADKHGFGYVHNMRNSESVKGRGTDFHKGFTRYVEYNF